MKVRALLSRAVPVLGMFAALACTPADEGPAGERDASPSGQAGSDGSGGSNAATGSGGARGSGAGTGGSTVSGGGAGGRGGSGTSGSAGAGPPVGAMSPGDDFVTGVSIKTADVDNDPPRTPTRAATILVVRWMQTKAADQTWLEFTFAGGTVMTSRPSPGTVGAHRDVVLGVPADTDATVRIVSSQGGVQNKTRDYVARTGKVPSGMPKPTVTMYDAAAASPDRWLFGSVENSAGGCANNSCYYNAVFWLYIMDRQGRIVWYYADPSRPTTPSFQRIARDGEYIWVEHRPFNANATRGVLKMTLDRQYEQWVPVSGLSDCIDVLPDGSLLYDASNELREMNKAGTVRTIWSCRTKFGTGFQCYTNTINWDPVSDSVLMSYPEQRTLIQIDRKTGAVVGQYGAAAGSYTFQPSGWTFGFPHFPSITPDGTLLLSAHLPDALDTYKPMANKHAFQEWEIDRANNRLVQKWIYTEGPEWAMFKGMAMRLPNGNTLVNYGTGGVIREVTPDKKTVFHVKFDAPSGNDAFNKMVGHNVLVNDLYALNGGGPRP